MAKKTLVVDDLDLDTEATHVNVEVSYEGVTYSLDLNDENKKILDEALAPYLEHGRRISGKRKNTRVAPSGSPVGELAARQPVPQPGVEWWVTPSGASSSTKQAYQAQRREIADWAREQGWDVGARGRLSREMADAWVEQVYNKR